MALPPLLPTWLSQVNRGTIKQDVLAGLVGAIVVLPQGMAYAILAGMPPESGLYAAMLPCLVAAFFGSSLTMVTGPANAISLTVLFLISPLAAAGSPPYLLLVYTLAFMVGVWQLLLALARAGRYIEQVSHTVIVGFTTGAAALIMAAQVPSYFGFASSGQASLLGAIQSLLSHAWDSTTTMVATATVIGCYATKRFNRWVPYLLSGLIIGCVVAALYGKPLAMVSALPSALPSLSSPAWDFAILRSLLLASLIMTVLALTEAVAIGRAMSLRNQTAFDANQELRAQGLANLAAAFSSGYPVSGSFNRSAVNSESGAQTPLSAIFACVFLLLILLFFGDWVRFIPKAVIAGLLMVVAMSLIKMDEIRHCLAKPAEALTFGVTLLAALFLNLEWAIGLGILVSLTMKKLWK
jgi:sulfate permease, SulP family